MRESAECTDKVLFDYRPESIDLDLDLDLNSRTLYWTDRSDPSNGNMVNRARMDRDLYESKIGLIIAESEGSDELQLLYDNRIITSQFYHNN